MFKKIVLAGLVASASAHMKMANPMPYDNANLDNAPLKDNGSDFPCKGRNPANGGASNVYPQGSKQTLKFLGTAVHGGGSCQVSVTTDLNPSKSSVWKVIKSIEGGCPAKNAAGNLEGNSASIDDPFTYDFDIPKELSAGNYTLAWTWFNRIGNREMYMNCAPLTVTGSSGSQSFMNGLPDMFVANVGNGCKTTETKDLKFPNPGKDLDSFGKPADLAGIEGTCQIVGGGGGGGGGSSPQPTSGGGSQPTQYPQPTVSSAPAGSQPAPSSGTIPGGVFITKSQGQASQPAPTNQVPVPTSANVPEPAPTTGGASQPAPTNGTGGGNGTAGAFAAGTACTSEGMWNCVGGTSFQRCASGTWSPVQAVAAGTSCAPGQANDLKMSVVKPSKRTLRRAMRFSA